MLVDFHDRLRRAGIKVSMGEWLTLMQGLSDGLGTLTLDRFYFFARLTLVKNEALYDLFDQIFDDYWSGREQTFEQLVKALDNAIPEDWLRRHGEATLSDEQKRRVESLGGWDELMQTLLKRLQEQNEEHQGGNRWIGTGGTSPFGNSGFNPQGIRIGQSGNNQGKAVKVWQKRHYRDLDGKVELGTRNFKMALRKLRRLARDGIPDRLDLDNTIKATADNAGLLDMRFRAERQNAVKVLLLIDIGGSMDHHAQQSEQLFSAARSEFKRLDTYWFHNCVYESLWKGNQRSHGEQMSTLELTRTLNRDHRLIIIGDATMSPYEISIPGGSVEHWNNEAGAVWLRRLQTAFPHCVWINPEPANWWNSTPSIRMIRELMRNRMYPMNVDGLQAAIDALKTPIKGVTAEDVPPAG